MVCVCMPVSLARLVLLEVSTQACTSFSPQLGHPCLDPHKYLSDLSLESQHTQIQLLVEFTVALPQRPLPGSVGAYVF